MWLLYSRYIHSGAEERITLPEMVADEFQKAVESRQLELLDSSIEIVKFCMASRNLVEFFAQDVFLTKYFLLFVENF